MKDLFNDLSEDTMIQLAITGAIIIVMFIARVAARRVVAKHIRKYEMEPGRKYLFNKLINLSVLLLTITFMAIVWDITFKGLAVYFTSFFAVAGVALFAQWSILSNITAAVILFFNYPFKIGSKISLLDKDQTITGVVTDITLFTIRIKTDKKEEISYPNTLALQKPIQIIKS